MRMMFETMVVFFAVFATLTALGIHDALTSSTPPLGQLTAWMSALIVGPIFIGLISSLSWNMATNPNWKVADFGRSGFLALSLHHYTSAAYLEKVSAQGWKRIRTARPIKKFRLTELIQKAPPEIPLSIRQSSARYITLRRHIGRICLIAVIIFFIIPLVYLKRYTGLVISLFGLYFFLDALIVSSFHRVETVSGTIYYGWFARFIAVSMFCLSVGMIFLGVVMLASSN